MYARLYQLVSGTFFGLAGLVHLIRVIQRWQVTFGPWEVSLWMSGVAAVACLMLGLWGWVEAGKMPRE
jgi:hypothetical protein